MIKMVDEYIVTYAVKEWLISNGWNIVAFNPPRAQGTFTIPNPKKAMGYRGQTGSKSPDLIAVKNSKFLIIVESKPTFNKNDIEKMVNLFNDKERTELLLNIVNKICKANGIPFNCKKSVLVLAKAHGGELNLQNNVETFHVSIKSGWDHKNFKASDRPMDYIQVEYYPSSKSTEVIVKG